MENAYKETCSVPAVVGGEKIGDRARARREQLDLTQERVAELCGVAQQSINQLELGKVERPGYILKLGRALECSPEWLETGDPKLAPPSPSQEATSDAQPSASKEPLPAPSWRAMPNDVPVRGVTAGGGDSDFAFNGGVIDYVRRPPGIAGAKSVFGLYVVNDSMEPRYAAGDLIYVHPDRPVTIGSHVIVELYPSREGEAGNCYIKKLVRRTATKLILAQYNPAGEITLDMRRVRRLYRVLELNELLGI